MGKATPIKNSFGGGEIDSLLDGRTDIEKYYSSCKTLENFIPIPQGGAKRRPGTYYVDTTKTNQKARLIPFQFSTTQSYILEFTDQLMRVYKDKGRVVFELATPYTEAQLFDLQYVQDADMMFIVHPSHKPRELTRSAHDNWALANYDPTLDVFTSTNNYPSCITIFEQRLVFANTNTDPQKVWLTKSGDYDDMTTGTNAGDGFVYVIGSQQVNAVRWLSSGRTTLMGTLGGVFSMSSGSDLTALTPTNVTVKLETTYGSIGLVPQKIGNNVYFVQRNLRTIREASYIFNNNEYKAFDMTILAPHITGTTGIVDMAYQQSPYNILWCVRTDGELACLTREIDQEVIAWSRQIIGGTFEGIASQQAVVESVAVIPGDGGEDEVWIVVKRTIDGSTVRYVEYFRPFDYGSEQEDAFFVDSGLEQESPIDITAITKADPGVVTATSHGLTNGNIVILRGITGMTELNRNKYKVAGKTDHTFELNEAGDVTDATYKVLLHMDGVDASTDFVESAFSKVVTVGGDAEIDTQYSKFGGASGKFGGTGYLSMDDSADFAFGTGAFTIAGNFRLNSLPSDGNFFMLASQFEAAGENWSLSIYNNSGTYQLQFRVATGGVPTILVRKDMSAYALSTWYHLAVIRTGNNFMLFQNGTQIGTTTTDADTVPDFAAPLEIGRWNSGTGYYFDGNMDEVVVVKGAALWTTDFTVPAEPYSTGTDVDTTDFTTYITGGEVRKCASTLSGLGHLVGETLELWIDGIERPDATVVVATITITEPTNGGGQVHAGLGFPPTLKPMRIEAGSGQGSAQSKLKRIYKAFALVEKSVKMNMGNADAQNAVEFDSVDDFIPEFSGWVEIVMPSAWDRDGFLVITQDGPAPLTVLAIVYYMNTSEYA